jgi:secreted trypsin-like serine protease
MKRLCAFCFFLLLIRASPLQKCQNKIVPQKTLGPRIISGYEASLGQLPWQAGITFEGEENNWFCGGSIISSEWILTAGHCIDGASAAAVYVGVVQLSTAVEIIISKEFILHESYNPSSISNDIGLVKLSESLTLNDYVKPIALASEELEAGMGVTVSGFGFTSDDDQYISNVLNYVTVAIIDNSECELVYGKQIISDEMVCGVANSNQGSCSGDSGGPVVTDAVEDPVLVALVSFASLMGCESGYPSGFTRTAPYRNWIKNITGV